MIRILVFVHTICVYCGSNFGAREDYTRAATQLGAFIAGSGRRLVYGGGKVGLMGVVADSVLSNGGEVVGVLPQALMTKELAHTGLTKLHVVGTMHDRKALMAELSDGFIAMPGGLGTLEELFEVWTWAQLGLHQKPIGLLNVSGFYDPLVAFLDAIVEERFVRVDTRQAVAVEPEPEPLIAAMAALQPSPRPKWISKSET